MLMLRPVANKWKIIGVALKLCDDFLDEVFANMDNDEGCLVEIMDNWVNYHEPSWKKLATALRKIGEDELALKCHKKGTYVHICYPSFCSNHSFLEIDTSKISARH